MDLLKEIIQKKKQELRQVKEIAPKPVAEPVKKPDVLEEPEVVIPLDKADIIFRLRKLKQPAKYFGESILDQYTRLQKAEEEFIEKKRKTQDPELDVSSLELLFPADRGLFQSSVHMDQALECQDCENTGKVWKKEKWKHPFIEETQALDYTTKSLVVSLFWKMILDEWKSNLAPDQVNLYESTFTIFKKLVWYLKSQSLNESVIDQFFLAARFCQIKNYQKAYDAHLQLSSMSTFHKNSHETGALNSDTGFRKVTQTFKRLITLSEKTQCN